MSTLLAPARRGALRVPMVSSRVPAYSMASKGHRIATEEDIAGVLTSGLIVLDTNVLLNLYRYNAQTRADLLSRSSRASRSASGCLTK